MKYDFDLALDQNTSTGKIIAHIKDGSRVLEFGPGNGRVTRYLTEVKQCRVSIVEFDKELYIEVMKFADDGFLGNIEDFEWCEYFSDQLFDVIIFADVLEHLQDPLKVLECSKKCLKSDGVFLVSFPNIGHNSVLIDLFNNNFCYNEYGLLDKTHNTFYTLKEPLHFLRIKQYQNNIHRLKVPFYYILNKIHSFLFPTEYSFYQAKYLNHKHIDYLLSL
ncbi:class I SAM-dependent methyltransferase [Eubacterium callanderi]|nr:class I SAM-dependent methyltransferase [Eubacterium callanderi]